MKIKKLLILNIAAAFLFASSPVPLLAANLSTNNELGQTSKAKNSKRNGNAKVIGSIVVTNNPKDIAGYAKSQNLKPTHVSKKSKNRPAFVTLLERPDDPRVKALAQQKGVEVVPNYMYEAFLTPNDTRYNEQWNLPKISAPEAWDITTGSSDVTVAVIDSGVLFTQTINGASYVQPDFPNSRKWTNSGESGNTKAGDACWDVLVGAEDKQTNDCDDDENGYIDDWQSWDFMGGYRGDGENCPNFANSNEYESDSDPTLVLQDNDPQPYACDSPSSPNALNKNHYDGRCIAFESACFVGHGTMVASVIAAQTNNGQLIAGMDHQAKIMSVRVLDGYGWGSTDRLVNGIYYAVDNGADVINMSLGSNCDNDNFTDSLIEDALKNAADAGVVMVAASGNGNLNTVCYPASSTHVMAIGATDINDTRESYSSYSNKLDVVAPAGVPVANAPSARINSNYYADAGGTSLSTPHVAGLAALIKGHNQSLSRGAIRKLIKDGADKVSGMQGKMFHEEYGSGLINAYTSLSIVEGRLPIYQLYRPTTRTHFYTASAAERDRAVNDHGFKYEGIGFRAE
ncbi:hypothetical protein BH23PAT1_BH23PAT1_1250 [soil metagenome]